MGWFLPALAGAALGGLASAAQNSENRAENREARRWQERMRNTEIQARVKDLEAAGLNPALAYGQGGASSPSTVAPSVESPVKGGLSSALAIAQQKANVELTKASADKARAEATSASQNARFDTDPRVFENRFLVNLYQKDTARFQSLIAEWTADMTFDQRSVFKEKVEQEVKNLMATHGLTEAQAKAAYAQALLTGRTNTTGDLVGDISAGLRWTTTNAKQGLQLLNPWRKK